MKVAPQGDSAIPRGITSKRLAKLIFEAELPESYIRSVPAQSLYLAIKCNGLGSSTDLIGIATLDQCRTMLDFDLWNGDRFEEENFWEWLDLPDENTSIDLLLKLIRAIDLKLIGLVIGRYVHCETFEEPTDLPPGPSYYTPDKGFTWVGIKAPDSDKQFLLGRLLALIFDNDVELFYQLLSIPSVATNSELEEESFLEKEKRLASIGIPEPDFALEVCSAASLDTIVEQLEQAPHREHISDIQAIEPLIYDSHALQPLYALLSSVTDREQFESELSLVLNSAMVRWKVPPYDYEAVTKLSSQVKGALNVGLELVLQRSSRSIEEIYERIGLQGMFHAGLGQLRALRTTALSFSDEELQQLATDQPLFGLVAGLREPIPELPEYFRSNGSFEVRPDGSLAGGYRAIQSAADCSAAEKKLEEIQRTKIVQEPKA